ncbi:RNA polymerase sigma factor SigI [Paenibacillus sp. 32O-W]|nr:RNA polymerase sigma factor SigI [Paenibacillus sp. 32O-W]ALS29396.1 RNA polymerase sigma factor SigI [Paenibacillus sp. 32O-W]
MLLVLFKRFLRKTGSAGSAGKRNKSTPEEIVNCIQAGDDSLRDQFIAEYQPYIAKVTSKFCKRYIDPSRDDEFSVALAAFNEAIQQYAKDAGRSFLGFAETVIRRRLIDHVRKEQRHANLVPYSSFDAEDEDQQTLNPIETQQALERFQLEREAEERRLEIEEYSRKLAEFGISFEELAESSPKHADSRLMLFEIGKRLCEERPLFEALRKKGRLPVKELAALSGVSRKTVERNRKYLIAVALIFDGKYPYLQAYLQPEQSAEGVGT